MCVVRGGGEKGGWGDSSLFSIHRVDSRDSYGVTRVPADGGGGGSLVAGTPLGHEAATAARGHGGGARSS